MDTHAAAGELCPDSVQNWALYLERFGRGRNFARDIAPKIAPGLAANECAAG